jgi:hypothetical protein
MVGELFEWVVRGRAGSVLSDRRGFACLLVKCSFVSFDSLAFLLDDTTTGQLVFAFASEMYDTVVYVFFEPCK